jgi:predicted Rossmann fold nucleotide-binding protein DprA/Smf involved in DNA uptake
MVSTLQYNIALTQLKGIGPILAKNLLAKFGSAEAVFSESAVALSKTIGIGTLLSKEIISSRQQALDIAEKELHINTIATKTSFSISTLSSLLVEMEFKGLVRCFPGNKYQLI